MKIIALCSVDESVLRSTLDLGEKDTIDEITFAANKRTPRLYSLI